MAIKRYVATANTTITNAYKSGLLYRATGSNMGEADSLEVFSIYAQAASGSSELSRILVKFPVSSIISDRLSGSLPASGSVNFALRMFNVEHPLTLPRNFTLCVQAVSRSWDPGHGVDLDDYTDYGVANWEVASANPTVSWSTTGGDYHSSPKYTAVFDRGYENLDVDITGLVEQWIAGTKSNYGIGVFLTSSIESAASSSYTKRFSARGSEYFFKKPIIEARWDSSIKDQRASFVASSSLMTAADNLNTIYLYNYVRGTLKNIPEVETGSIYVKIWDNVSSSASGALLSSTVITGGFVATGIYSASFALNTTGSYVYDRWYKSGLTICYHTGSIKVQQMNSLNTNDKEDFVVSMPNLRDKYHIYETPQLRLFVREKNWCPNIYTRMTQDVQHKIVENIYYKITRVTDELVAVDYGTGSLNHTRLSYDVSGSYFDFPMNMLESGYMYKISYLFALGSNYREAKEKFKFRVE